MSEFQEISQKHEEDIKGIIVVEHDHLQKFLITKVKTTNRLEQLILRIEKYMQHFREMKETLSFLMDQHMFPYMHMCEYLFSRA
jgi:hypothetical protein